MEELSYRLVRFADPVILSPQSLIWIGALFGLCAVWLRVRATRARKSQDRDTYCLPVVMALADGDSYDGYIRQIGYGKAILVVPRPPQSKGMSCRLEIRQCPDIFDKACSLNGTITRFRSLGGLPESWQVDIKLLKGQHGLLQANLPGDWSNYGGTNRRQD